MKRLVVIGGGFAGLWSAMAAARVLSTNGNTPVEVVLVSKGPDLVVRPRLYEPDPASKRIALDSVLGPLGVRRIEGTVTTISTGERSVGIEVEGIRFSLGYDRLVLASGSELNRPAVPGLREHAFSVDTLDEAIALEAHLAELSALSTHPGQFHAAIIGAGFTGLEVATELSDALRGRAPGRGGVTLIEQSDVVGPELGPGPRPVIQSALTQLGIGLRLGVRATAITTEGVMLDDHQHVDAATVVWTAGLRASPLTELLDVERDPLGRLLVDETLRVEGFDDVYAAGDVAAAEAVRGQRVFMSCQHAIPLGKFAGHNAACSLIGHEQASFSAPEYVTCLDLGSWGALFSEGWERKVVLTGEEAKELKRTINGRWIYPPRSGNREELFEAGDPFAARR